MHTADNRAYLATVLRTFTQIPPRETSDTLVPLCVIPLGGLLKRFIMSSIIMR
jgi:hypothetical protein